MRILAMKGLRNPKAKALSSLFSPCLNRRKCVQAYRKSGGKYHLDMPVIWLGITKEAKFKESPAGIHSISVRVEDTAVAVKLFNGGYVLL